MTKVCVSLHEDFYGHDRNFLSTLDGMSLNELVLWIDQKLDLARSEGYVDPFIHIEQETGRPPHISIRAFREEWE